MTQYGFKKCLEQFEENASIEIAMFDGTKIKPWNMGITFLEEDIVHIMTREGEFWVNVNAIAFIHYII